MASPAVRTWHRGLPLAPRYASRENAGLEELAARNREKESKTTWAERKNGDDCGKEALHGRARSEHQGCVGNQEGETSLTRARPVDTLRAHLPLPLAPTLRLLCPP